MRGFLSAAPLLLGLFACGARTDVLDCPAGQGRYAGACEIWLACGAGTHTEGVLCVANTPGLECGEGTVEQGGACVTELACGPGTFQDGDYCVPGDAIECGPGTVLVDGVCVSDGPSPTPLPDYEVRLSERELRADGFSSVELFAIGRLPDGQPSTETIELSLSRAEAGRIQQSRLQLTSFGATTRLTACSSAEDPACAGPVVVRLALAARPEQILAESVPLELLEAPPQPGTAPCDPHPNALYFDGDGYIFRGQQLVTEATWASQSQGSPLTFVGIDISPDSRSQGSSWRARFAAPDGQPLAVQLYPTATRYPFNDSGEAGLSVTGDGRGCNRSSGSFEVYELTSDESGVVSFLATFEQFCETQPTNYLRGCVKFTR